MTQPATPGNATPPASLGEQIGRTRSSVGRLVSAHVGLLKAEIGEIIDQLKVIGTLAAIILVLALLMANMLYIGGLLFLGEWLFGSIGWGLAHGVLLAPALAVVLALGIVGAPARASLIGLLIAVALTTGIAVLCGSNIAYNSAVQLGANIAPPFGSPGVIAAVAGAVIGALIFMLLLARMSGRGGAIAGLLIGAVMGALVGWLIGGAPWTWPPAAGFAITIGLISWPMFAAAVALPGLDPAERFSRLYPKQSIEAFAETRSFLEEQWASRRPMPGKK